MAAGHELYQNRPWGTPCERRLHANVDAVGRGVGRRVLGVVLHRGSLPLGSRGRPCPGTADLVVVDLDKFGLPVPACREVDLPGVVVAVRDRVELREGDVWKWNGCLLDFC